ncbi:MAG TPA: hypothetical protein VF547_07105 [Allosphingosinicella sp.]|jgi:hypothetical protein
MSYSRREILAAAGGAGLMIYWGRGSELHAQSSPAQRISALAATSAIRTYHWLDRGRAPRGYTKGMAVAFGRTYCKWKRGDPIARRIAAAASQDGQTDALAWYSATFSSLAMSNSTAGADVLRHVFALLMGLGMRESSGQHCEGRDMSANNVSAATAEAGLFQVSFNSIDAHPGLRSLFQAYQGSTDFSDIFGEGVTCGASSWRDWGTGEGKEFQRLTKACPAFAVEYAALGLRVMRRHWGPLNTRKAEVRRDADSLFRSVQTLIDSEGITEV